MTTTRRTLALALAIPMLALAACGGSSDEDKIKDVVNEVSKDSSTICDHASKNLLAQLGGKDKCAEAARAYPDKTPSEIKGDINVKVNGDKATADFTDNEGKKQHVTFVKEDGEWKADSSSSSGG